MHVLRDFRDFRPWYAARCISKYAKRFYQRSNSTARAAQRSAAQRSAAQRMCERPRPLMTEHLLTESRAVLTNGHTGHVPRAPGFFFLFEGPQLAVVK